MLNRKFCNSIHDVFFGLCLRLKPNLSRPICFIKVPIFCWKYTGNQDYQSIYFQLRALWWPSGLKECGFWALARTQITRKQFNMSTVAGKIQVEWQAGVRTRISVQQVNSLKIPNQEQVKSRWTSGTGGTNKHMKMWHETQIHNNKALVKYMRSS